MVTNHQLIKTFNFTRNRHFQHSPHQSSEKYLTLLFPNSVCTNLNPLIQPQILSTFHDSFDLI